MFRKRSNLKRAAFQVLFLCSILFAGFIYETVSAVFGPRVLQSMAPGSGVMLVAAYATVVLCVAVPLKIWHSARTERRFEAQNRLLIEARLAALTNQINPHFLFNTLNSISTLIRVSPEEARGLIYKLSNILRRLLRKAEPVTTLREELAFVDDYLAIEIVRFGSKLRVVREVDSNCLDLAVPGMLLQPIVENSIKHGLANQTRAGHIAIRAHTLDGRLHIVIEDDGAGMDEARLAKLLGSGVGVSNVNERLQVLFGADYRLSVDSRPGEGTRTEIELPADGPAAAESTGEPGRRDRELPTPAVPRAVR